MKLCLPILFLFFVYILLVPCLWSAGLDYLAKESDAIVVGGIKVRTEGPTRVTFRLSVSSVLQGNIPGQTLEVVHDWAGLLRGPDRVIQQSQTGLWFLKRRSDETWDVIPSRPSMYRSILGLFLPASDVSRSRRNSDLSAQLVEEVASRFYPGSGEDPEVLVGALDGVRAEALVPVLPTLLSTGDPGVLAVAIAAMLERQTPDAIAQLVRFWPTIRNAPTKRFVLSALRDSWRDTRPDSVRSLVLLANGDPEISSVASTALSAIHTREALLFLANLLFADDPTQQFHGLYGVSAFVNGCPVKTRENVVNMQYLDCREPSPLRTPTTMGNFVFRPGGPDQQAQYLSFWRDWWRATPQLH